MNQVVSVELENNPQYGVVVSSRKVAEGLGKKHYHVMRDLDQILENSNLSSLENPDLDSLKNSDIKANIIPATYTVANQKRKYREYLLTKDGFTLYMFNIQGYNDFKWAYIQKFNEMEAMLATPVQQLPVPPTRKTWNGNPVMTIKDVALMTKCGQSEIRYWLDQCFACGVLLSGEYLVRYKQENNISGYSGSKLIVLYRHDVESILLKSGIKEDFKVWLDGYFIPTCAIGHGDMRFAVKQASLLYKIAREIKDPVVKEMNLKAVTALLIDIGLWTEKHAGFNGVTANWDESSLEGWNKRQVMLNAKRYWPLD
ncbi:MAG: Rha family transcriptional regulator [Peptococcaceae bacterium]|nr:Rha family transcriptional regulator [Peptococcaceae bacterium]